MPTVPKRVLDTFGDVLDDPETDMIDAVAPFVAPTLSGRHRARKAVVCTVAAPRDRQSKRGRVHVLLHGPGGTGKTVLRDWVKNTYDDAMAVGAKSSGAGLKGSTTGGKYKPGALTMADGGIICIDELDKIDADDRKALYESMSEGEYEINQAGVHSTFDARVSVVATANDIDRFSGPLLDRFDFVVEVPEYDEAETVDVTHDVYDDFVAAFIDGDLVTEKDIVRELTDWCSTFEPDLAAGDTTLSNIKTVAERLVRQFGATGNIRTKEGYLRVAYTLARLNREDLAVDHFRRAIQLVHGDSLNGQTLDADALSTTKYSTGA